MRKVLLGLVLMMIGIYNVNAVTSLDELQEVNYQEVLSFEKPAGYDSFQGFTITDKYFVAIAIKDNDTNSAIVVYDKTTKQKANLPQNPIEGYNLSHANDLEYNATTDEIYVVDYQKIHVIDGKTFKEKDSISIPLNPTALAKSNNNYYFYRPREITVYDDALKKVKSFPLNSTLTGQGISVHDNLLYSAHFEIGRVSTYEPDYNGLLPAGASVVYVYDLDGKLKNTLYFAPGKGELENFEFDGDIPYAFFITTDGKGHIYTPTFKAIKEEISANIDSNNENFLASLSTKNEVLETVTLQNGKFVFSPIAYQNPGTYEYTITKYQQEETNALTKTALKEEESLKEEINVDVDVKFDASLDKLVATVNYENGKDTFTHNIASFAAEDEESTDEEVAKNGAKCTIIDGKYYDNEGKVTTKENYLASCDTVENPKTGAGISILLGVALGVLSVILLSIRKRKFYKVK